MIDTQIIFLATHPEAPAAFTPVYGPVEVEEARRGGQDEEEAHVDPREYAKGTVEAMREVEMTVRMLRSEPMVPMSYSISFPFPASPICFISLIRAI